MTPAIILDVLIAAILLTAILRSSWRGLFLSLSGVIVLILTIIGANLGAQALTQPVADWATPKIEEKIAAKVEKTLEDRTQEQGRTLEELLPDSLRNLLNRTGLMENLRGALERQAESTIAATARAIAAAVARELVESFAYAILYVLLFLALGAVLHVASLGISMLLRLPLLSSANTLGESGCTFCGQCITHCPVGGLQEHDDTGKVFDALADTERITVVQMAPAVRSAWADYYHLDPKFATAERMVTALKTMGFDYVFDTDFAADLTIMEEGSEFIDRFTHRNKHRWPMFTSCCPGWVRFLKGQFPSYTENLSTAKSPQQMFGAVAKSYFAQKLGVDPHKIFVVSIMPCTAKKAECALPTMKDACGDPDVDVVLTTREIVRMFRGESINPAVLPETPFDTPLGTGTGAAVVFGATGGVMDAALRSAYYLVTGKNPDADAFSAVRGMDGWKEATFAIPGAGDVHVAVVSGLGNTRRLMHAIDDGKVSYDFVEVMACPGGCAGGGGQPIHDGQELAAYRGDILWSIDKNTKVRFSHENADVQALYREFFRAPLGEKSHHLLHTDHTAWKMPNEK